MDMGDNQSSGIVGLLGLILCVVLFFVIRRFFPALAAVLLGVVGVVAVGIAVLVAVILYFAFSGSKKKDSNTKEAQLNEMYSKGRRNLTELRMRAARVKNQQVRSLSEEICASADKILKTVKEQPEDIGAVRQFLNYYLPTLGNILQKFVRLEESGVPNADMAEKTIAHLKDINLAMQKQYANLFEDDKLDLSVEMEALTLACKRDGLLTEEDFSLQSGENKVTLTL